MINYYVRFLLITLLLIGLMSSPGRTFCKVCAPKEDAFSLLAEDLGRLDPPLFINEIMASNDSTITDSESEYDDWIEIYNAGDESIDIGGMYLTDNLGIPTKWLIPDNVPTLTTISPKGFIVIWADDNEGQSGLHASFELSATGEDVGIFDRDGTTLIDSIIFDEQHADISYGRYPDGTDNWRYMVLATPGSKNISIYQGVVEEPKFSRERGFYDESFYVTLNCETEGATIYYTLDYSEPYGGEHGESNGTVYTEPILITETTCLRAIAYKYGWMSSKVVTSSYIFLDDVLKQPRYPEGFPQRWGNTRADYEMDPDVVNNPDYSPAIKEDLKSVPSVSIVINNDDIFGAEKGIYANPLGRGEQWERPASMEWIDPNTGDHFGVNAGLRIHGGPYSRQNNPKKALRVIFRSKYGVSKLEFPLFPDTEVDTFNTLALRSIWNYSWTGHCGMDGSHHADYLRDAFARDTVRDMEHITPYGRAIHVYINGLYWGMYIMTERPDERFVADHLGGDKNDYDMLEAPSGWGASTVMEIIAGGEQARQGWFTLFDLADENLASSQAYQSIQAYVDIHNMIDYMLMIYYTGSRDAPVFLGDSYNPRNFYVVRRRDPAGPFLFIPWDTEWALEQPTVNRVNVVGVYNPHYLMDRLAANAEFRIVLADHIHQHFYNEGTLTRDRTTQRYLDRADEIFGAIVGESARWGDYVRPSQPYTRVDWQNEVNRLVMQYFSGRTETVIEQLKRRGWYPNVDAPVFHVNGSYQHGGYKPLM